MRIIINLFAGVLAYGLCLSLAGASSQPVFGYGQVYEFGGGYSTATVIGTCLDGSVMVDVNGVVRCGADTTTDPQGMIIRGGACYELDGSCTAPDLTINGGIGLKQVTALTQANCDVTDSVTITVTDVSGTQTANVGNPTDEFACITDDATCKTALTAWIDGLAGVSAQESGGIIGVRPDDDTVALEIAEGGDCVTVSNGADGDVNFSGSLKLNVGEKLILDGDTGGNDYIIDTIIGVTPTVGHYVNDTAVFQLQPSVIRSYVLHQFDLGAKFPSNDLLSFGDFTNYWQKYNSTGTAFELWSTDVDGGGTDGKVLWVEDGTDDVVFGGGVQLLDTESLKLGTGADQALTYTDGTGVTWSDGTNTVLTVPDDSNQVVVNGGLVASGEVDVSVTTIDCDDDPYTVPAGVHYLVIDDSTGTCTGNLDVTLPAADCAGTGNACRRLNFKRVGNSVQVDIGGNGGTETIDGATTKSLTAQWDSLTIVDVNQTSTDWIIE